MRGMTIENIARACGGVMTGCCDMHAMPIFSVTTDSREVSRGALFVAIKGERSDGHDFINEAFKKGAWCCLCERLPEKPEGFCVVVESTERALCQIAAYYRSQFDIPIIGVTGSVGKTSAKEMIAAVLSRRFNVLRTEGNFNNELGVPLTLFRLRDEHEAAVVELGVSDFGEMSRLGAMARPDMAVYTVIGHAHLEFFKNREGVLRAKTELLDFLPPDGVVFVNGDDELLAKLYTPLQKLSFGTSEGCWARGETLGAPGADGTAFRISIDGDTFEARVGAYGSHMVSAALAAAAVGRYMGLTDAEIAAGIADYKPVGSRARLIEKNGLRIIDDCYNANPDSVAAALRSLSALPGRRVCVLGDMLELGADRERLHYEVGQSAAAAGCLTLCCGELARSIFDGASENGGEARRFESKAELIPALGGIIQKGDNVLVKASRGLRFEDIVAALMELEVS